MPWGTRSTLGLSLVIVALAVAVSPVVADSLAGGEAVVANPTDHNVFLIVEGGGAYVVPPRGAAVVPAPSHVCVAESNVTLYESMGERLVLRGWLSGSRVVSEGGCVEVIEGASYTLLYGVEYRVRVSSQPPGVAGYTFWAPAGSVVRVEAPVRVERGGFAFELAAWEGVTEAEGPNALVAVVGPVDVTAVYRVLVVVNTSEGVLAVPSGSSLLAVAARASWEEVLAAGRDIRLVLQGFRVNGTFVALEDASEYALRAPAHVEPVYVREYLVEVRTPAAAEARWVPEGSPIQLAAPSSIDVNETVKLSFVAWKTPNGTLIKVPAAVANVTQPGVYEAVYNVLYRVEVRAPFGSSTLWARAGELLPITQPVRLPGVVYDRVLAYYIVNGRVVEPGEEGLLLLRVTGPTTVVAVYTVKANVMHLAVIAAFLLSIAAAYIAYNVFQASRGEEDVEAYGTSG